MENKKIIVKTTTLKHVANRTITTPIGTVTFNENCEIVVTPDEAEILLNSGLGFKVVSGDVSLFKEPTTPSVRVEKKNEYDDVFVKDLLHSFDNLKEQNRLLIEENDSLKQQITQFNTLLSEKETKLTAVKDKVEDTTKDTELIEKQKKAILGIKSLKEAKEFAVDFPKEEWDNLKDLDKMKQYLIGKL